jgi:phospholipid transport system substrate-binding protein
VSAFRSFFRALGLVLALVGPAWAASSPTATVEQLNAAVQDLMREAGSLDRNARQQRIAPVLNQVYDFAHMARVVAGPGWQKLKPAEQQQLTEAFARLTAANYAQRIDRPAEAEFKILGEEKGQRGTVRVKTEIVPKSGDAVPITYELRQTGGDWRVVDVLAGGQFSELARRRGDYGPILERQGLAGLLRKMESDAAPPADRPS